jgi:hypothetical protein
MDAIRVDEEEDPGRVVLRPRRTAPRPPSACALDLRALALFRVAFALFYMLEFSADRAWSLLGRGRGGDGLYGIRSEALAPRAWIRANFPQHSSIFLDHPDLRLHVLLLLGMMLLAVCLLLGKARTPVALTLCVLDRHWINRNPLAADEHTLFMNRMLFIIAFVPCDAPLRTIFRGRRHDVDAGERQAKIVRYDNSWGSWLLCSSIVMLWTQVGVEKMIDFQHWWVDANAVQFSLVSNHCLWPGALLVWFQSEVVPMAVAQWICRIALLVEFPVGPLLLVWPSDTCRSLGLFLTGGALLTFGVTMSVDWFPFSVFVIQLAMLPASVMDRVQTCLMSVVRPRWLLARDQACGTTNKEEKKTQMKETDDDRYDDLPNITISTLPEVTPKFPRSIRKLCRKFTSVFLAACTMAQIFCGIQCFHYHRGASNIRLISEYWDLAIVRFGDTLPLRSGWRVASPPPKGLAYWTLVGIPRSNSTWHNPEDMGIFVQFHRDRWSFETEGTPIMDVFWDPPPGMTCAGFRQFLVSEDKYFHQVLTGHARGSRGWITTGVEVAQRAILTQACKDFHFRNPGESRRLERVELWYMTQLVEEPWEKRLSPPQKTFVTRVPCPDAEAVVGDEDRQQTGARDERRHFDRTTLGL